METWTREQEELQRLLDSSRNDIDKMMSFERQGMRSQYIKLKNAAKSKLKNIANRYPKLEKKLQQETNITDGELRRRANELKRIKREYTDCRNLIENKNNERGMDRDVHSMETYGTMELSNMALKQQQYERRKNMDNDLDEIHKGIKRINVISTDIDQELSRQHVVIDEIGVAMDHGVQKLAVNNKRVEFLSKKSKDKGCCCLMTVLFLCIVALFILNLT